MISKGDLENDTVLNSSKTESVNHRIQSIENNTEITILKIDKDNATVMINTEDYMNKMKEILQDETYHDPITYLVKQRNLYS